MNTRNVSLYFCSRSRVRNVRYGYSRKDFWRTVTCSTMPTSRTVLYCAKDYHGNARDQGALAGANFVHRVVTRSRVGGGCSLRLNPPISPSGFGAAPCLTRSRPRVNGRFECINIYRGILS